MNQKGRKSRWASQFTCRGGKRVSGKGDGNASQQAEVSEGLGKYGSKNSPEGGGSTQRSRRQEQISGRGSTGIATRKRAGNSAHTNTSIGPSKVRGEMVDWGEKWTGGDGTAKYVREKGAHGLFFFGPGRAANTKSAPIKKRTSGKGHPRPQSTGGKTVTNDAPTAKYEKLRDGPEGSYQTSKKGALKRILKGESLQEPSGWVNRYFAKHPRKQGDQIVRRVSKTIVRGKKGGGPPLPGQGWLKWVGVGAYWVLQNLVRGLGGGFGLCERVDIEKGSLRRKRNKVTLTVNRFLKRSALIPGRTTTPPNLQKTPNKKKKKKKKTKKRGGGGGGAAARGKKGPASQRLAWRCGSGRR